VAKSEELVKVVKVFTDAVRANNLKAAQEAFAPSRQPWERIEPIAGLVEDTDAKTDSRVDDFANVDDPAFTGWHRLEYLLFEKNTTEGGAQFADRLDADIANLQKQLPSVKVKPIDVANGAAELIEEVSEGKLTGEEDRYSKTDLYDFDANLQGSQVAIDKLSGPLKDANAELLGKITAGFSQIFDTMRPLRQGDGWVNFCPANSEFPSPRCPAVTVAPPVVDALKAQLAGLSENLSQVAGALKLQ
jgi:iron uptake system component EfeO